MAQTIKIKRSSSAAAPGSALAAGELAYSFNSSKLFIGDGSANDIIGGELFVNMLDHTAGTLTASSAIIVDSNSKIDQLKTANLTIGANSITAGSGNVQIVSAADLDLDLTGGSIDTSSQATEILIIDNNANAFEIKEGVTSYLTFDTTNSAEKITLGAKLEAGSVEIEGTNFDINGGTIDGTVIGGSSATAGTFTNLTGTGTINFAGATVSNGGSVTTVDINGGTIDGAVIGGASAAAITGTTITATTLTDGTASISSGDITGVTSLAVDNVTVNGNDISTTNSNGNLTLSPNGNGTVTVPSGYKDRTGFGATSLVSKEYVDAVKVGLDFKDSVRVATTGNISISTAPAAIDGVTLSSDDRVLVKDQSTGSQNGIYVFNGSGSAMTRATDADANAEVTSGMFTFVTEGSVNADSGFVLTTDGSITVGSTALAFAQFSGAGQITAGAAMTKTGNTLDVEVDGQSLEVSSDALRIKGITQTATGDLIFGNTNGANSGYQRLTIGTYDSTNSVGQMLQVGANSTVTWTNTIDGGTFS
jgi:hypothetical protein